MPKRRKAVARRAPAELAGARFTPGQLTPAQASALLHTLDRFRDLVLAARQDTPCERCLNYTPDKKKCLWWGKTIPEEWLPRGCDAFVDEIPF